jgi:hypothetical protein
MVTINSTSKSSSGNSYQASLPIDYNYSDIRYYITTFNSVGSIDSNYYKILMPLQPITLSSSINKSTNQISYSWTSNTSGNGYKLYITDNSGTHIQDLTTTSYDYNITSEGTVTAYVVAYLTDATYGTTTSPNSNTVTNNTYPFNNVSNINGVYDSTNNRFDVSFTDNSTVEDKFIVSYHYEKPVGIAVTNDEFIEINSTTKNAIGNVYRVYLPIDYNYSSIAYSVKTSNSLGDTNKSSENKILMPLQSVTLTSSLDVSNKKISYSWTSNVSAIGYKLYITDINGTHIIDTTNLQYDYNITTETNVSAYVVGYIYDAV